MSTPPRQNSIKTRPGSAWRMASAPAELQDDHRVVQEPLKERALDRALAITNRSTAVALMRA